MRKLMLTLFLVTTAVCHGQHILTTSANAPRAGDSLVMRCVGSLPTNLADNHMIWDLSKCTLGNKRIRQWITPMKPTDTLECFSLHTRSRHLLRSDTLYDTGHENNLTLMFYNSPLPIMRMPMSLGDSIGGLFQGWGIYCERLYLRVSGGGYTVADAIGTLIMPNQDTLRHVLRLHSERATTLDPIDSIHSSQELSRIVMGAPLAEEEIQSRLLGQLPLVRERAYTWFAPGWRYPVAEMTWRSDRQRCEMTVFLPEDQLALDFDLENELRRQAMYEDAWSNRRNAPNVPVITGHHANYDTHGQTLGIEFTLASPGEVSLSLCNSAGVVYHSQTISCGDVGSHTATISCAGLPHGQFVLAISAGQETYTEKFNRKQAF